jgi:hypothetical protein
VNTAFAGCTCVCRQFLIIVHHPASARSLDEIPARDSAQHTWRIIEEAIIYRLDAFYPLRPKSAVGKCLRERGEQCRVSMTRHDHC